MSENLKDSKQYSLLIVHEYLNSAGPSCTILSVLAKVAVVYHVLCHVENAFSARNRSRLSGRYTESFAFQKRLNYVRPRFRLPQALETKPRRLNKVYIYVVFLKLLFSILSCKSEIIASDFISVLHCIKSNYILYIV